MNEKALKTLLAILEVLREEVDAEMPTQMAVVFLHVALREGITMKELGQIADLSQASMSRNVAALSHTHRKGKAGHRLIVAEEDPEERRRKVLYLTATGRKLLQKIEKVIHKGCDL